MDNKIKHLDSEYRDRWEEFYLANGTVEDSRLKNWRDMAWEQVTQITVHMVGCTHTVNCKDPRFKAFMNFRWGGQEAKYDRSGKYIGHKQIKIWTIGWTNGVDCYLKDICFYTGELIKEYISPLFEFKNHIHPDVIYKFKLG